MAIALILIMPIRLAFINNNSSISSSNIKCNHTIIIITIIEAGAIMGIIMVIGIIIATGANFPRNRPIR